MAEPGFDEEDDFFAAPEEPEEPAEEEPQESEISPEQVASWKTQAANYERFANDPDFARQVVLARAAQLGLQVAPPQQPQAPKAPAMPTGYVEQIADTLDQPMKFLAPQIAKATWEATQAALEPVRQQQQQQVQRQQSETYEGMVRELAQESPGWERYEDEMLDILTFLKDSFNGGKMSHPKHGNVLRLLYRMASGDGAAIAQANRRQAQAVRNQTRTSSAASRGEGPDLQMLLGKAKTSQDKWAMAYRHALRENNVG